MLIVSSMLKHAVYPCLAELKYFPHWRSKPADQVTVLTYHGVFPQGYKRRSQFLDGNLISAEHLHRQLSRLKSHYDIITPEDFKQALDGVFQLPRRSVLLSCDDGLANVVSEMLPVLQSLDLKCIFFLTAGSQTENPGMLWYEELWLVLQAAGAANLRFEHPAASLRRNPDDEAKRHAVWWQIVRELSKTDIVVREDFIQKLTLAAGIRPEWKAELLQNPVEQKRFQLLTATQVDELVRAGMTLGAHTASHPVLPMCTQKNAEIEISQPLQFAMSGWKTPVWAFAYPFGTAETVSSREVHLAETAGYRCAFMNIGGSFLRTANKFAIPRINITGNMALGEFEAHASGFHQYLQNKLDH